MDPASFSEFLVTMVIFWEPGNAKGRHRAKDEIQLAIQDNCIVSLPISIFATFLHHFNISE